MQKLIPSLDNQAFNLLTGFLDYNPETRTTAENALKHPYFTSDPLPAPVGTLPEKIDDDILALADFEI